MSTDRRVAKGTALKQMLSYRRAHNSPGEKQYIQEFILPLNPELITTDDGEVMAFFVRVGQSPIMFTSHTDTVHMTSDKVWQDVLFKDGCYYKEDNQPLGADDAAGNYLMIEMIKAKVPGIYAFFRGEERGGIGSTWCAKHRPELFNGVLAAIAFDRRGTTSVITHQAATRGCSDEFGDSLARLLGNGYRLDRSGIYTDTAEFFHLVPNCTNISVGYEKEHSKFETLDAVHIAYLVGVLITADWSTLDHTPPQPEIDSPLARLSPWQMDDYELGQGGLFGNPREIGLNKLEKMDVTPLNIADFLFDYADRLPRDLRDKALKLSQIIYKRFE